jgi:hypothetical protein
MRERMRRVPALGIRLQPPRSRWRRSRWITDHDIDFSERIRQVTLGETGVPDSLGDVVDSFFSAPCDPTRNPWEMLLVQDLPGDRAAIVVKVHHAVGDSHAIIATLSQLFDETADRGRAGATRPGPGRSRSWWPTAWARARGAARILRGFCHLAPAGTAHRVSVRAVHQSSPPIRAALASGARYRQDSP